MNFKIKPEEEQLLKCFFFHAIDAMCGDDRPDHGLAMLQKFDQEQKRKMGALAGRYSYYLYHRKKKEKPQALYTP